MTNAERQKKYREKRNAEREKLIEIVTQPVTDEVKTVTPVVTVHIEDVCKCPKEADPKEWAYAVERAARAKKYALAMPEFIRPTDLKFQDPLWQLENETRGRFAGKVGGVSDNQQKGN